VQTVVTTPASERELVERYYGEKDLDAREELIRRLLPLARRLAARHGHDRDAREELFQVACVALVKGVDRYDPERGTALSSYLVPTMLGEIRRHFRDCGWAIHVPRELHDRAVAARAAADKLWQRLGRAPTAKDLAQELGVSSEDAIELLELAAVRTPLSLDAPRGAPDEDFDEDFGSSLGREDDRYDGVLQRSALARGLSALTPRERLIVKLRFEDELKQREIADRLGISQMHVSRLLRRTLDRLRIVATAGDEVAEVLVASREKRDRDRQDRRRDRRRRQQERAALPAAAVSGV
jgi:RNA polymerase sigma-B factor